MVTGQVGMRALLPYLKDHRGTLAVVAVLSLVSALTSLVQPVLVRDVLDGIQAGRPIAGVWPCWSACCWSARRSAASGTTCCSAPPRAWC